MSQVPPPPPSPYEPPDYHDGTGYRASHVIPGSVKTIGIISIVWGCLGLLCCGGAGLFGLAILENPDMFGDPEVEAELSKIQLNAWDYLAVILIFPAYAILIAGGIGTLRLRSWGRLLSMVFAAMVIIMTIGNLTIGGESPLSKDNIDAAELAGNLFGIVISLAYPIVLLVFFNMPDIKKWFVEPME